MKFLIDNKEQEIPDEDIEEISVEIGDMIRIYDYCGSSLTKFQCKDCEEKSTKNNQVHCHKMKVAFETRSQSPAIIVLLKNGNELFPSEILD